MDTSVLSAVYQVHTSLLRSISVYLCYNDSCCHVSVFIFSHFLLELHQTSTVIDLTPNSEVFFPFALPSEVFRGWIPGTTRDPSCKRLSVAVLCGGFLATWAVDHSMCDSVRSCDKAPFLEVVCMFDAGMCVCLMVGVCRATLPECWCVTLQHCLAYPVNLLPSSPPSSPIITRLSLSLFFSFSHLICWSLLFIFLPFVFFFHPFVQSH